jgi:hypothetical protein
MTIQKTEGKVMGKWRHFPLVLIVAIFGEMMQNVCSAHLDLFPFSMLNINIPVCVFSFISIFLLNVMKRTFQA